MIIAQAAALVAAGCGGDDTSAADTSTSTSTTSTETTEAPATTEAPTTTGAPEPAECVLGEADNGAILRVRPGDAVTMRLPVEDPGNPQWVIAKEPDSAILQIIDSLLWIPSEPGADEVYFEFVFLVVGTGETDVTFSFGPVTPTARTVGFSIDSG